MTKPSTQHHTTHAHTQDKPQQPKKLGRNDPCPCGSGKKYKKCCIDQDHTHHDEHHHCEHC